MPWLYSLIPLIHLTLIALVWICYARTLASARVVAKLQAQLDVRIFLADCKRDVLYPPESVHRAVHEAVCTRLEERFHQFEDGA